MSKTRQRLEALEARRAAAVPAIIRLRFADDPPDPNAEPNTPRIVLRWPEELDHDENDTATA
jgi:hypothetical protein